MKNKRWIWIIPIILTIITILIYFVIYLKKGEIPRTEIIRLFSEKAVWRGWPMYLLLPIPYYWIFDAIPIFIFSFLLAKKIINVRKASNNTVLIWKDVVIIFEKEININYKDLIFIISTFFFFGIFVGAITFVYLGLLMKIIATIILGIMSGFFLYDKFEPNFIALAGLFFGLGVGLCPLSNFGFPLLYGILFYYVFLTGFLIKTMVIKNSE